MEFENLLTLIKTVSESELTSFTMKDGDLKISMGKEKQVVVEQTVNEDTPSLAISVLEEFRRCGIGTALMQQMLTALKQQGYPQVSLSVQKANYAARMYEKLGFEIVEDKEEEYIMVHRL